MEDDLHSRARLPADPGIADVAFDQPELFPAQRLLEIGALPGGEVVETDDPVPGRKQSVHQVRTDEPGAAGHQIFPRLFHVHIK